MSLSRTRSDPGQPGRECVPVSVDLCRSLLSGLEIADGT
jgi:hypothetical protein